MKKIIFAMATILATTFSCNQKPQQQAQNTEANPDSVLNINCLIEVTPENRDSVIALSTELVDSSRNDAGNIGYDILQSATDSTKLMILECWKDQASLDAHSNSPHFTRLVPQIQSLSKMNIQVFKKDASNADNSALRLNCPHRTTDANRDEAINLMRELVKYSLSDAGVIDYDLYLSLTDPNYQLIFETWKDQASLDAHSNAPHFTRLVPQIGEKCKSSAINKYNMPVE